MGQVTATGAALEVRSVGFKPEKVILFNKTSLARLEWNKVLADAEGIKQVAAGTTTNPTSDGITPLSGSPTLGGPGFQIGALADINDTAGELIVWEAWSEAGMGDG
jgi:hypothetical protein